MIIHCGTIKAETSINSYNPDIANTFFRAGFIEAWGRGTLKIIKECKKADLPEPEFKVRFAWIYG